MRLHPKKWLLALVATALGLLVPGLAAAAGPQQEKSLGLPRDVSVDGHRIDWLLKITLIFVTILFVIMVAWMLIAVFRHGKDHKAEYDHGDSRHAIMIGMILSAVIFFVVDGNLWVNATKDLSEAFWNFGKAERDPGAVRIEINAHQWAWDARYPGPDQRFNTADDVVTLNDLRIPIGRPVIMQLASVDVIHSFSLPNFRVKMDATPGMTNRFWFRADPKKVKPGEQFEVGCTQHCGTNHYKMRAVLTVLSDEDYERWVKETSASSQAICTPPGPDDAKPRVCDLSNDERNWGWRWKTYAGDKFPPFEPASAPEPAKAKKKETM